MDPLLPDAPEKKEKKSRRRDKKEEQTKTLSKGILVLFIVIVIVVLAQFVLPKQSDLVKGAKTEKDDVIVSEEVEDAKERVQGTVAEQLDDIKKDVVSLDPEDFINTSPQVQRIISDLKALQGLPKEQVKSACEAICESI